MQPELFFVYWSFESRSSWQIIFIDENEITLQNFEKGKLHKTSILEFKKAIEDKKLKEHTKQNEMIKYYNNLKK